MRNINLVMNPKTNCPEIHGNALFLSFPRPGGSTNSKIYELPNHLFFLNKPESIFVACSQRTLTQCKSLNAHSWRLAQLPLTLISSLPFFLDKRT